LSESSAGITSVLDRTWSGGNATIAPPSNLTAWCGAALTNLTADYAAANATLLGLLVDQRLGNLG